MGRNVRFETPPPDDDIEGSEYLKEQDEALMGDETHPAIIQASSVSRVEEVNGTVELQIIEISKIQLGNSAFGKVLGFNIADYDPGNFDLQDKLRQASGVGDCEGNGAPEVQLSQEVNHFSGQAHSAYASGDRDMAMKLLQHVITVKPGVANAWGTLALCYEVAGDSLRAVKLRITAAHLEGDSEQRVELGQKLRSMEQAVQCYRDAARLGKTNPDIL
ncbi:unnamed protein product [Rhizoctonia solani]|uniref:Uncharacterized protein n=1 Tax=Rhizoctonia solani TaxID=456999 RepID=A0A8H3CZ94_9AGAM|nr:unnamed protein product [Rhizoctonia solani]